MATTVEDILDKHCFSATDEREKGDRLQRMMVQSFTTDVVHADRISDDAHRPARRTERRARSERRGLAVTLRQFRSTRRWRDGGAVLGAMVALFALSWCFDFPPEGAEFANRSTFPVVVLFEGTDRSVHVGIQESRGIPEDECLGSGIVVTSDDGDVLAAFDGPACPGTLVLVDENGDVTARDGDEPRTARATVP